MAKKRKAPARVTVSRPRASNQGGRGGPVVVVRESVGKATRAIGRRRASGVAGANIQRTMQAAALGGAGVGLIEKYFGDAIPTLPFVGRKGAVALAVYFFKPKSQMIRDVGLAAAALAGYELAKEGRVSGEDDDE